MSRQVNYAERGVQSPPVLSLPSPVCPRGYRPHQERGTIEYAGAEGEYILWRVWEDDVRVIQGITPWQFRTRAARSASGGILVELYIHARRAGWHWVYPNPRKPGELYCKSGCPTWPVCKHVRLARAHLDLLARTVIPCARCGILIAAADPDGMSIGAEVWCGSCASCPDCGAICNSELCECDPNESCPACRMATAHRLLAA